MDHTHEHTYEHIHEHPHEHKHDHTHAYPHEHTYADPSELQCSCSHSHTHSIPQYEDDSDSDDGRASLQATLAFSISTSSPQIDLSASDEKNPFRLIVSVRIQWSKEPSKPITVCALRNALDTGSAVNLGAFNMTSNTNPDKWLSLDLMPTGRPHFEDDWPANLRDAMEFITIPSQESGESVKVEHILKRDMITGNLQTGRRSNDTLESGEICTLQLSDNISIGWWHWGGLQDDLKDKKFALQDSDIETDEKESEVNLGDDWVRGFELQDPTSGDILLEALVGGDGAEVLIV